MGRNKRKYGVYKKKKKKKKENDTKIVRINGRKHGGRTKERE